MGLKSSVVVLAVFLFCFENIHCAGVGTEVANAATTVANDGAQAVATVVDGASSLYSQASAAAMVVLEKKLEILRLIADLAYRIPRYLAGAGMSATGTAVDLGANVVDAGKNLISSAISITKNLGSSALDATDGVVKETGDVLGAGLKRAGTFATETGKIWMSKR